MESKYTREQIEELLEGYYTSVNYRLRYDARDVCSDIEIALEEAEERSTESIFREFLDRMGIQDSTDRNHIDDEPLENLPMYIGNNKAVPYIKWRFKLGK